jgi:hypothetical protein
MIGWRTPSVGSLKANLETKDLRAGENRGLHGLRGLRGLRSEADPRNPRNLRKSVVHLLLMPVAHTFSGYEDLGSVADCR